MKASFIRPVFLLAAFTLVIGCAQANAQSPTVLRGVGARIALQGVANAPTLEARRAAYLALKSEQALQYRRARAARIRSYYRRPVIYGPTNSIQSLPFGIGYRTTGTSFAVSPFGNISFGNASFGPQPASSFGFGQFGTVR